MARNYLVLVIAIPFLASCGYSRACYDNLAGIYAAEKGEYNEALSDFGRASVIKDVKYIEYNIGTVYRDLGEFSSAEKKFSSIDPGEDSELLYRLNYELGAIAFRDSLYEKAAQFFKNAVMIDNSDLKLIQNLELSLLLLNESRKEVKSAAAPDKSSMSESKGSSAGKLLDMMFSGEVPFWFEKSEENTENKKDW